MILTRHIAVSIVFLSLLLTQIPAFALDYYQQQVQYQQMLQRQREQTKQMEETRYRRQVGDKALSGAANIVSAPLEIPKNIINVTNEDGGNIFYGLVGGVIKGSIDAAGRISNGVADLVTAPIPTKTVVNPKYVWDDFDESNTYGKVMRLVDNPKIEQPVIPAPKPMVEKVQVDDQTLRYSEETNRNLDNMFKNEMKK